MTQDEFLSLVNKEQTINHQILTKFQTKTLWLKKEIQEKIKKILYHRYPKIRLRYSINQVIENPTTVWFLDEIGKERPISFAISVKNDRVQLIRVLEFRESRGFEIHISAFVEQFEQSGLNDDGKLSANIDGITGATMSVNAMKKIARLAIFLHQLVLTKKH